MGANVTEQQQTHTVTSTYVHPDGWTREYVAERQPGTAADAHDHLARRWRAAGYDFTRDPNSLTLTREDRLGEPDLTSTLTVTHSDGP